MPKFKRFFAKKGVTRFMKKYLEKAKRKALTLWRGVKNLTNSLWNFTLKHVSCIYTASVVSLVFGLLFFFSELDHAKQVKEMEKETLVLISDFEETTQEYQEVIDFQSEINQSLGESNQKLGEALNQAKVMIEMQKRVIQQLVYELQKAGIIPAPTEPEPAPQRDPRLAI